MRAAEGHLTGLAALALAGLLLGEPAAAETAPLPQPRPSQAPATEPNGASGALPRARPTRHLELPAAKVVLPHAPAPALPQAAPAELRETAPVETAAAPLASADVVPRLPQRRPAAVPPSFADPFAAYGRTPAPKDSLVTAFVAPPAAPGGSSGDEACRKRLAGLGVEFRPASGMKFASTACTVDGPLTISSVGAGLSLKPEATLNCRTTEALALWMRDVVVPAARKHLGTRPTGIAQASAYVCRPRNNQAGEKLSEHATGNAVDIASIGMEGRAPLDIRARGPSEAGERAFQAEVRQGACRIFTTVLGPGSNAAHATHFHFDLAQRRGGFRLCD